MSAWRKKAMEILPGYKKDFEEAGTSIYEVFGYMLSELPAAHQHNNTELLKKIYAFAEWCHHQKAKDLWNAAGVAFYEHLGDRPETLEAIPHWVKPAIYIQIKPLLEARLSDENIRQLDQAYKIK
jgi:hypothetical protein